MVTFPLVDAFLLCPEESSYGKIGLCTNALAPSMVINEIPFEKRHDIAVLGTLVVNRDGCERIIVNCLSHPTMEYLILFGEETLSFRPSTNLLCALMYGYEEDKKGNFIRDGRGISHQYPSIPEHILDGFRNSIHVLPLYKQTGCDDVITTYLEWLKDRISSEVYSLLVTIRQRKNIYYDSLLEMIELLSTLPSSSRSSFALHPADFQHLQPPLISVPDSDELVTVPFRVVAVDGLITVTVTIDGSLFTISGNDSFLLAYSLLVYFNEHGLSLSARNQLFLGAELSRVEVFIRNTVLVNSFVISLVSDGEPIIIPVASRPVLQPDSLYYYKIGLKDSFVSVQSLAHDTCTSVFELRSSSLVPLLDRLASENRFEDYAQTFLHRVDVGIEVGRAYIALITGNSFFQDFRNLFSLNITTFPLFVVEADSFLANHQKIITSLYTRGLSLSHPDAHKGTMRAGCVLACYRRGALEHFPAIYSSGSQSVDLMRSSYKEQLLSFEPLGEYTYGHRTRAYFGYDQLEKAVSFLRKNKPFVIQRFDYVADMTLTYTSVGDRVRVESTSDPCLTHDIYFLFDGRLHSFHIARAHNIVNAYPENVFGLYDAYDCTLASSLGVPLGDFFMLSNRANILLLTEEQKAKKLIAEPSKPLGDVDSSVGPYLIGDSFPSFGIGYVERDLAFSSQSDHPDLALLENYRGVDLISKASLYLRDKGIGHNNPIIGTYDPFTGCGGRLVFFQCNVRGGKLQATGVFLGGNSSLYESDIALCNYIATCYHTILDIPLGTLFLFYILGQ